MAVRRKKQANKRPWWQRLWRAVWITALSLLVLSVVELFLFKHFFPPLTPLMAQRWVEQLFTKDRAVVFEREYVKIEAISPNLITAVVAAEDGNFLHHKGFDVPQLKQAYLDNCNGKRMRGGSTISMQTAKNVFLPHSRNYVRKAFEAVFTICIERLWGKERIMEVYLNVVEFGDGIYGCEAASQCYFHHSAATLTSHEAALLAASLPSPLRTNPSAPSRAYKNRTNSIEQRMKKYGKVSVKRWREVRDLDKKRGYDEESLCDFLKWVRMQRKVAKENGLD